MNRQFQAVIFDLDGTLLDTLGDIAESANAALERLGLSAWSIEAYRQFIGDGVENLARRIIPADRQQPEFLQQFAHLFREEYGHRWTHSTQPYPGIPELLDQLTAHQVPMAVLSNKPDEFTQQCVRRFLGRWPFRMVLGDRPQMPRKPDPAGALQIARALEVPAEAIVYLGDTKTDMETARSAGMFAVGVLWGFRTAEELLAHGAQKLISHPLELLVLLGLK
ncbi:MAG: HAD family hydrolase [Thermoguttaceae bacterium]|nr:HAD family hydrolase [Thermoguttaceae bacterium]MDW8038566.1 HAD family hydrolase [Thermoguttaceae bacterium]